MLHRLVALRHIRDIFEKCNVGCRLVDAAVQVKGLHAYVELKRRITTLQLAPGQLLHEPELSVRLGFGRTPLREAIQRLAQEKLVIARPRQTAFVAPILADELAQIVEMRLILELPAARMAAQRASSGERAGLRAAGAVFGERVRANDVPGTLAADADIHRLIASMGRNSFLCEYAERLGSFSQRIWWLSIESALREEHFVDCHDALVQAICSGDATASELAAEAHLALFQQRLNGLVQPVSPLIEGMRVQGALRPGGSRAEPWPVSSNGAQALKRGDLSI